MADGSMTAPEPREATVEDRSHPRWCDISGRVLTPEEHAKKMAAFEQAARILLRADRDARAAS
jgi:hypothetical protein